MTEFSLPTLRTALRNQFKLSAAAFAKAPTASNWIVLRFAMFNYQAASQLRPMMHPLDKLEAALEGKPETLWGDTVIKFLIANSTSKLEKSYLENFDPLL